MAGCPIVSGELDVENSELVVRQLFAASINPERGFAAWQAYRVLAGSVGVASLLPRVWYEDELVSRSTALAESVDNVPQFVQTVSNDSEERNYQLSEITLLSADQGRVVPMSSFAGTPYWSELNFLSNMAPLPFELRVGSWSRLDQAINGLADRLGEVYVLSGPIYGTQNEVGPKPAAYFKLISAGDRLSAFIFASDLAQHANFCTQASSLESIETATGLNFYPQREGVFTDTLHEQLSCSN